MSNYMKVNSNSPLDMKYLEIWSKNAAASDSTDCTSASVSSCTDTPKLLPSSILGIINDIHIFIYIKTRWNQNISFQIFLQADLPD